MSVRTFHQPEQRQILDAGTGDSNRKEERGKGSECWEQSSRCLACDQGCDALLILPCSHFMCHQCVAAEEGLQPSDSHLRRAASLLLPCAVWCPSCRCPVELPCQGWSSAASCLPACPSVDPAWLNEETTHGGPLQQVRDSACVWNIPLSSCVTLRPSRIQPCQACVSVDALIFLCMNM